MSESDDVHERRDNLQIGFVQEPCSARGRCEEERKDRWVVVLGCMSLVEGDSKCEQAAWLAVGVQEGGKRVHGCMCMRICWGTQHMVVRKREGRPRPGPTLGIGW